MAIQIKTLDQLKIMRQAGLLVGQTLELIRTSIKAGMTTDALDAIAAANIKRGGGISNFKGYHGFPATICVSVNEEIVARLSSRRTCRDCGAPSVGFDKCPTCGGEVYQREDDKAEVIKRRLEVYSEQTAPIIAFYRNEGLLISVSAVGSVEAITDQAISALKNVTQ